LIYALYTKHMYRYILSRSLFLLLSVVFLSSSMHVFASRTITRGDSATVNWIVSGAPNCTGDTDYSGPAAEVSSWKNITTSSAAGSSTFPKLTGNSGLAFPQTYIFTCNYIGAPANATSSDTLTINDCTLPLVWNANISNDTCQTPAPTVTSFTAASSSIANNATTSLSWTSTHNGTCSIDNGIGGGLPSNGSTPTSNLTTNTTYTITCTNAGGSDTRQKTISVGAAMPDLTADDVTATDGNLGTPALDVATGDAVTYSSIVRNVGSASTGAGFNYFFQVNSASNGGGSNTDLGSSAMGSIINGNNRTGTVSHTFNSPGTYSIRACADKSNSGDVGVITESNEGNNCSANWVDVVVHDTVGTFSRAPALCRIADNNNKCQSSFDWTTSYALTGNISSVFRDGTGVALSTSNTGSSVGLDALGNGSVTVSTFRLKNNGTEIASALSVTAECNNGSAWSGASSQCKPCQNGGCTISPHICDNGGAAPDCTVAPVCILPNRLDSVNNVCADPEISSLVFDGEYYPGAPDPAMLKLTCTDSTDYAIYRNGGVFVGTTTYAGIYASTTPAMQTDTYTFACIHGDINKTTSRIYHFSPTLSDQSVSKFNLSANSISPGGKVTISWLMKFPTASCKLTAKVICPNNACNAAQQAFQSRIDSQLAGSSTDPVPAGSRSIMSAVSTVAPGAQYGAPEWLAAGAFTTSIDYTTEFTYSCGAGLTQTRRISVTKSGEQ
jgi:hypothetical protein